MQDYLSDRERYIVENHPQQTYAAIAAQFGICPERARQIKHAALRKIQEEKRRERILERGQELVTLTLPRHDVWLILRSLHAYQFKTEQVISQTQRWRGMAKEIKELRECDLLLLVFC